MSSIEFWLLMFSLWFNVNVSVRPENLNARGMLVICIGVWGSLAMVLINLVS